MEYIIKIDPQKYGLSPCYCWKILNFKHTLRAQLVSYGPKSSLCSVAMAKDRKETMPVSKIAFRTYGEGPLLLLLHGYGGSPHHWKDVVPGLSKRHTVCVPNLSHIFMGKDSYSFSRQVEILSDFLREHFPSQVVTVAGISYGAALAWALALSYPDRFDKAIFVNPMPPSPVGLFAVRPIRAMFRFPLSLPVAFMLLKTPFGRLFLKRAAEVFRVERAERVDRLYGLNGRKLLFVAHIIQRFAWITRGENWSVWQERMEHWAHPSMLIYDKQDPLFREASYLELAKKLTCEKILNLPGAGHIATHKNGKEIAKHIVQFLDIYSNKPSRTKKTA